jgi:hypothetical protein
MGATFVIPIIIPFWASAKFNAQMARTIVRTNFAWPKMPFP